MKVSGERLYKNLVYNLVKRNLSKVATLKKKSPHVLRHTFATTMLNNNAELGAVKELLGHESITTTEIYTHATFEELKKDCLKCNKCPLAATRTNVVFGVGPEDAEVLFIGEGPGENEDLTGQQFVGRGGKLLDQYLYDVDLDRNKNIYIANIVKCCSLKNRDPQPLEQESCEMWVREQVRLMRPKIIV